MQRCPLHKVQYDDYCYACAKDGIRDVIVVAIENIAATVDEQAQRGNMLGKSSHAVLVFRNDASSDMIPVVREEDAISRRIQQRNGRVNAIREY